MLIANLQAGRLLETHGSGVVTYADFIAFRSDFQGRMAKVLETWPRALACGDLRGMEEIGADVAPAVLGMLRADNVRLERAAYVVTAGSAFHRQYEGIVGATRHPGRQVFTEVAPLLEWLGPSLQPDELARLRAFLGA